MVNLLSEPIPAFAELNLLSVDINVMEFHRYLIILINFLLKCVQKNSEGHYDSVKSKFYIF